MGALTEREAGVVMMVPKGGSCGERWEVSKPHGGTVVWMNVAVADDMFR